MGFTDDLLIILSSYPGGYRRMREMMRGIPARRVKRNSPLARAEASEAVFRTTLSRLKKRGLVENHDGIWKLTQRGQNHLINKSPALPSHSPRVFEKQPKNMIVAFDIPEREKRKRGWLRRELANLGFEMLQKSIWLGPSPVPKDFIQSLRDAELLGYIKFFRAHETEIV